MKPEEILRLAKYYFPEEVAGIPVVHADEDGMVFITLGWNKPWNPHLSLDHCALTYPILEKRGLTHQYIVTLAERTGIEMQDSLQTYWEFHTYTISAIISEVLLAVCDANGGLKNE